MFKLNLGCGRDIKKGYINLDRAKLNGVDIIHDLSKFPYPFPENHFNEILSFGTVELIDADFIKIMEELWRISENKGLVKIRGPVFPSMCSAQDPLTKKFLTWNTFEYFNEYWGHYTKARFRTLKKRYIYSLNSKLNWLSFLPNIFPTFYTRFLFFIFPCNNIYYELEVIKEQH